MLELEFRKRLSNYGPKFRIHGRKEIDKFDYIRKIFKNYCGVLSSRKSRKQTGLGVRTLAIYHRSTIFLIYKGLLQMRKITSILLNSSKKIKEEGTLCNSKKRHYKKTTNQYPLCVLMQKSSTKYSKLNSAEH